MADIEQIKNMIAPIKIDDLPDNDSVNYPVPFSFRISLKAQAKLEAIKARGKCKTKAARAIWEHLLDKIEI